MNCTWMSEGARAAPLSLLLGEDIIPGSCLRESTCEGVPGTSNTRVLLRLLRLGAVVGLMLRLLGSEVEAEAEAMMGRQSEVGRDGRLSGCRVRPTEKKAFLNGCDRMIVLHDEGQSERNEEGSDGGREMRTRESDAAPATPVPSSNAE